MLEKMEAYFNSAIAGSIVQLKEDYTPLVETVEHEVVSENSGISLYLAHVDGNEKWNSDTLNIVIGEYYISLLIYMFIILLPSNDKNLISNDLGLSVYQYMKAITVTSEVHRERLLSNNEDEPDALYFSDWILNSIPLYSDLTVSKEDLEEEITDEVMFTTQKVKEYIQQDKNNRILYTPVFRDGKIVKRSWFRGQRNNGRIKEVWVLHARYYESF